MKVIFFFNQKMTLQHNPRTNIAIEGKVFTKHTDIQHAVQELYFYNRLTNDYIIKPTKVWLEQTGEKLEAYFQFHLYDQCCRAGLEEDLLEALYYLEIVGVIHNDIKKINILYDPEENRHKLIDFGNARTTECSQSSIGTYYTSSPEVLLLNTNNPKWKNDPFYSPAVSKQIGASSDMWSYACVIYQQYTGEALVRDARGNYPYTADDALEIIHSLFTTRKFEMLEKIRGMPFDTQEKMRKTLVINPSRRALASSLIKNIPDVYVQQCSYTKPLNDRELEDFIEEATGVIKPLSFDNETKTMNLLIKYKLDKAGPVLTPLPYLIVASWWINENFCRHSYQITYIASKLGLDPVVLATTIKDMLETVNYCIDVVESVELLGKQFERFSIV
jgi:serine/threonine protein kinase